MPVNIVFIKCPLKVGVSLRIYIQILAEIKTAACAVSRAEIFMFSNFLVES